MDCSIYNRSEVPGGYVGLINLYQMNNSHAEFGNLTNYNWTVACNSSITTLDYGCGNNNVSVVQLWNDSNSHVSINGTYSKDVCFNTSNSSINFSINISTTGGTPADYECAFAVYNLSNSHVFVCDHTNASYNMNIRAYIPYTGCIDLDNELTYQNKVVNTTDNFYINDDVTLCTKTYYYNDSGSNGVIIMNASSITLDCDGATIFGNNSGYGIYNYDEDSVTIKGCTVKNYTSAIYIRGVTSNNYVRFNNIINNTLVNTSSSGIYLWYAANNTIENNYINRVAYFGVYLYYYAQNNTVESNTINGEDYTDQGIRLHSAGIGVNRDNIIKNNNITDIKTTGIFATGTSNNNTFYNNTIFSSGNSGIKIDQSDENNVTENRIFGENNAEYGIYLRGALTENCLNNNIKNNQITNTTLDGIRLEYANLTTVYNNTILSAATTGIYVLRSAFNNFTNNRVLGDNDTSNGIDLVGWALRNYINNTIENNQITEVENSGINLNYVNQTTIYLNTINYSQSGINFTNSYLNTIENNTFYKNDYGVYINSGTKNIFYYNYFTVNSNYHAYSAVAGNSFNTTVGGFAEGNWWGDIVNMSIYDVD
ncbi:right-handed parallel beta-helix repeat-containing protein, partial [Candidatus Woesearchaeota archaeon]|nr:right-handed parallel beta-helix repeat-containing protein [Candidatus Woesearchaeota archaeon]